MSAVNTDRRQTFKGKFGKELGFGYYANSNAWMRRQSFFDWLSGFDTYVLSESEKEVLLLIEKCAPHEMKEGFPELSDVKVKFS